jgi:hypothetical protein
LSSGISEREIAADTQRLQGWLETEHKRALLDWFGFHNCQFFAVSTIQDTVGVHDSNVTGRRLSRR